MQPPKGRIDKTLLATNCSRFVVFYDIFLFYVAILKDNENRAASDRGPYLVYTAKQRFLKQKTRRLGSGDDVGDQKHLWQDVTLMES